MSCVCAESSIARRRPPNKWWAKIAVGLTKQQSLRAAFTRFPIHHHICALVLERNPGMAVGHGTCGADQHVQEAMRQSPVFARRPPVASYTYS